MLPGAFPLFSTTRALFAFFVLIFFFFPLPLPFSSVLPLACSSPPLQHLFYKHPSSFLSSDSLAPPSTPPSFKTLPPTPPPPHRRLPSPQTVPALRKLSPSSCALPRRGRDSIPAVGRYSSSESSILWVTTLCKCGTIRYGTVPGNLVRCGVR